MDKEITLIMTVLIAKMGLLAFFFFPSRSCDLSMLLGLQVGSTLEDDWKICMVCS